MQVLLGDRVPTGRHVVLFAEGACGFNPPNVPVTHAPFSMLRGKSIEEIVNRWSTELETRVKEFNKFASEVAV